LFGLGWLLLVGFVVAGCASHSARKRPNPPEWEANQAAQEQTPPAATRTVVQPEPVLAPPPTNAPAQPAEPGGAPGSRFTFHASRSAPHFSGWVALARWCKENQLPAPTCVSAAPPAYELKTSQGTLVLRAGSQIADWDGLEVRLGFAPQLIDSQPFLHALDLEKTIEPLLACPAGCLPESLRANPVIVIDPGHGGENVGTKSVLSSAYEKEFTLDWAVRLERLLATNGWQVFLTRSNDANPAISNRVAFAEEHKAALFLSLHFNSAAPNDSEAGLETYCLTPCGMTSTVTRGYSDDATESFPNNAFDAQNLQLACLVHRALLQVNGNRDRGVRRARFPGVLRGQQRPAILIEGGYLSNPREARLIADPAYREKLAEAVAGVLVRQSVSSP
jgi:N-acetylmuramoyl-L-alanine amidase